MFAPDAAVPASVVARNPRRRQRTSSDDSVALRHNPKRIRRSALTTETFQDPDTVTTNGHVGPVEDHPLANGHAKGPGSQHHGNADATSLAIRHRGVKKADRERRTSRNDGGIELASDGNPGGHCDVQCANFSFIQTRNENYVVTQLPTTPDSLLDRHASGKTTLFLLVSR